MAMKELVQEQLDMFKEYIKRPLTPDEIYLVRNSFQNGFGAGKIEEQNDIINMIKTK